MRHANYRHWIIFMLGAAALAVAIALPATAIGEVPLQLSYQGYLTSSAGNPVDEPVDIQFSIYETEIATTPLWQETHTATVSNGVYNVRLGSQTPLTLPFDQQYYLGAKVESDDEMTPRQALTSSPYALGARIASVVSACGCDADTGRIQQAIDGLPAAGGSVFLKAGVYHLTGKIHINRSNVTLRGEQGTLLRLADEVDQPVLLIGTAVETPSYPADRIENIHVSHFEIDGNRFNQTSEFDASLGWIRNNAIDVRMVDHLWIEDMHIHSARSGGIVVSWDSHSLSIANTTLHDNHFDGIALYKSEDVLVANVLTYANDYSGISLDNDLQDVTFAGGHVKNNSKNGIFVRDAEGIQFHDLLIDGNMEHGAFLANNDAAPADSGVKRIFFQGCAFTSNSLYGLLLTGVLPSDFADNAVVANLFLNNASGCFHDDTGTLLQTANICQ